MDDLVQWLGEQLDEDERIARTASWSDDANAWHAESSPFDTRGARQRWYVEDAMEDGVVSRVDPRASDDEGVARHIAEWDPARALREIDAKRQLVDLHPHLPHPRGGVYCECMAADGVVETDGSYCDTLRLLALPYADRPGFREEWRP